MKRSRRVTRWVIAAMLLLIGGAIVNVAVAWGCAVLIPRVISGSEPALDMSSKATGDYWLRNAPDAWHNAFLVIGVEGRVLGRADLMVVAEDAAQPRHLAVGQSDAGWPILALRYTRRGTLRQGVEQEEIDWGYRLGWQRLHGDILPLLPLWPGSLINTIFYAAILWLVFAVAIALRRKRRWKRGLCPACAYPIGTSPVCTECGRVVKRVTT